MPNRAIDGAARGDQHHHILGRRCARGEYARCGRDLDYIYFRSLMVFTGRQTKKKEGWIDNKGKVGNKDPTVMREPRLSSSQMSSLHLIDRTIKAHFGDLATEILFSLICICYITWGSYVA